MKELTIQEKAKRYDEAINLVNSKWHYKNQPCFIQASEIFPELKESKDDKIITMNKDNKIYKPVYIKCTEQNKGKRIIETLEKLGGINKEDFVGDNCNALYYIKPNYIIGMIDPDDVDTSFLIYFLNTAEEVKTSTITAKYCYILSFGLGKMFEHFITKDEVNLTIEEILKKHGLNEDECSVMYSNNKLNFEPLED